MSQSPTSSWGEQYLGIFRSRHIRWYCLNLGPFYLRSFVLSGEVRDSVERPESYGDGGLHSSSSQASAGDCGVPCRGEAARPALMVLSPSPMLSSSFCTTCLSPPHPPFPAHSHPHFPLPHFLPPIFVSPCHLSPSLSLSLFFKSIYRAIRFANERAGNWEQREPEPKREQV